MFKKFCRNLSNWDITKFFVKYGPKIFVDTIVKKCCFMYTKIEGGCMKKNICILCRDKSFAKKVAYLLSCDLDMFYADIDDMIAYNLADLISVKDQVGTDYITKEINGQIRMVSSYENTVYTIAIATMNTMDEPAKLRENSLVIYLDTPTKIHRELVTKSDVYQLLHNIADINITLKNKRTKDGVSEIKKQLNKFYQK